LCSRLILWGKIMILHVKEAKYLHDYVIWIKFNDGIEGEVDLEQELTGEIFGPLKDKKLFRSFKVDPMLETIVWKNGADLAPEFLRDNIKIPV
ncbi:MAG: DUF2442 domain-containing protein, partial [Candidatus Heimdallarchaeota archaeon]